jgi:hypothetical protein
MSNEGISPKHRENADGTFDSVCAVCYQTIATRDCEADPIKDEVKHACIRSAIYTFMFPACKQALAEVKGFGRF